MPNDANEGDNADALSQWQAQNDGSDEWMQWSVSLTTDKKGAMLDLDIGIILQTFRRITLSKLTIDRWKFRVFFSEC